MFGGLLGKLKDKFTDDKGLFQGGAEGRIGGRSRDFLESDPENEGIGPVNAAGNSGWKQDNARAMAKNFNPQDPKSVLKMQQWLNEAGYTDNDGNELSADGIIGRKTLSALRRMQGNPIPNSYQKSIDMNQPEPDEFPLAPNATLSGPEGPTGYSDENDPSSIIMQRNQSELGETGIPGSQAESDRYNELFPQEQNTLDKMFSPAQKKKKNFWRNMQNAIRWDWDDEWKLETHDEYKQGDAN